MNTMMSIRRPACNVDSRLHPLSPARQPVRPFGVGLYDPEKPEAYTGHFDLTSIKLTAPTPVPANLPERADGVPASVSRIAIISGDHRQTFKAIATTGGRAWESDTGKAWVAEAAVTSLYQAGRVAILKDTPRGPTAEDYAFEFGRSLGLELEGPSPAPGHYTASEVRAFDQGQAEASREIDAKYDAMANAYGVDWSRVSDAEMAEAGISPPAFAFN